MEKATLFTMRHKGRVFTCVCLFVVSLLVIGAAKVTAGLNDRKANMEVEKIKWTETLLKFADEIPSENADAWKALAQKDPQLLVMANTSSLHSMNSFSAR